MSVFLEKKIQNPIPKGSILENQRKEISIKFKQKRQDRQIRTDISVFEKNETEKNSQWNKKLVLCKD